MDRRRLVAIGLCLTVTVAIILGVATVAVLSGVVDLRSEGNNASEVRRGSQSLGQRLHPVDVSRQSPLIEIPTRKTGEPIRLYVVERGGKQCRVLVSPGGIGTGCGGRTTRPNEVGVHPSQIGTAPNGMLLVWGEVGSRVSRLELHFEDGRMQSLPLTKRFALYQVDPADYAAGRRPLRLIGRDGSGKALDEQRFNLLRGILASG